MLKSGEEKKWIRKTLKNAINWKALGLSDKKSGWFSKFSILLPKFQKRCASKNFLRLFHSFYHWVWSLGIIHGKNRTPATKKSTQKSSHLSMWFTEGSLPQKKTFQQYLLQNLFHSHRNIWNKSGREWERKKKTLSIYFT